MAVAEPTYTHAEMHSNGGAFKPPGRSSKQVPFKVTRTFIDVNGDIDDDDDLNVEFSRRQFSEPAPRVGMSAGKHAMPAPFVSGNTFGESSRASAIVGEGMEGFESDASTAFLNGGTYMGADGSVCNAGVPPDATNSFDLRAAAALAAATNNLPSPPLGDFAAMTPDQTPDAPPPEWASTVTVMMRNIPNKYTKRMLLTEINHNGFLGTFDFLYLPIDPETAANRGYAFLNFIDPSFAWMFKVAYEGQKMNLFNSHKVVSITAATLQGFEANYAHYSTSRVNRGDPSARPLFLREPAAFGQMPTGSNTSKGMGRRRAGGPPKLDALAAQQTAANTVMQQDWAVGAATGGYAGMDGGGALGGMIGMNVGMHFGGVRYDEEFVPPTVPPTSEQKATASFTPKFCPYCGSSTRPDFKFCPNCGGSFDFARSGAT